MTEIGFIGTYIWEIPRNWYFFKMSLFYSVYSVCGRLISVSTQSRQSSHKCSASCSGCWMLENSLAKSLYFIWCINIHVYLPDQFAARHHMTFKAF